MKTFKSIGMAILAIGIYTNFISCSDDGKESPIPNQPAIEEFTQSDMNFTEKANEQTFTFTTNADWTISVAPIKGGENWCTASPTQGNAGNQTVKIAVVENSTYDDRSVTVTLKSGTESKSFVVTQKQKDALLLTSDKVEINQTGGDFTIEVKANINYTAIIEEDCKDWIKEKSNTRTLSTTTKTYSAAVNEENEKREGTITFTNGTLSETVHIYQAGGDIILLSKNEYNVDAAGEDITVELRSNCEYEVEMPKVDWIHEISTRAMSSHTLYYSVDANETYESREAEIIYRNKTMNIADTLNIIQAQKDAIILGKKTIEVKAEGETIEIKLSTNIDYEVEMPDVDWITTTTTRGLTEHTLYYKVEKNDDENSRSANIIFNNNKNGLEEVLTVTQQGKLPTADITITVSETGTLGNYIEEDRRASLESLKIIGNINGDDIKVIKQMINLKVLDLSEVNIVKGGEDIYLYTYYEKWGQTYYNSRRIPIEDNVLLAYMIPSRVEYLYLPMHLKQIVGYCENSSNGGWHSYSPFSSNTWYTYANGSCSLKMISIPSEVFNIGDGAFANTSLNEITIPDCVTSIGKSSFEMSTHLKKVSIGKGVKTISEKAFRECRELNDVIISEGVEDIKEEAFGGYCNIKNIHIPSSVNKIRRNAFGYSPNIINVFISNIGDWLNIDFENINSNPFSLNINESNLYLNDTLMTLLTIPQTTTEIKKYAFVECNSLQEVHIGNQVTSIGEEAFKYCRNLSKIVIGDGISVIPSSAFYECNGLKIIHLGRGIKKIEGSTFYSTKLLTEFYCYSTTPPTLTGYNFNGIDKTKAKLYVPKGTYQEYYLSNWGIYFTNIIEMEE